MTSPTSAPHISPALGGLVILGGAGFLLKNIATILAPRYDSTLYIAPMMLAMVAMALWLLLKEINPHQWDQQTQPSA